jgi:hypothetical protein
MQQADTAQPNVSSIIYPTIAMSRIAPIAIDLHLHGQTPPQGNADFRGVRKRSAINLFLKLAVVSIKQPVERQVLIQIGPMQPKRRNFNVIQLFGRARRKTRIFRHRKANLRAAFHADDDPNHCNVWQKRESDNIWTQNTLPILLELICRLNRKPDRTKYR